MFKEKIYNIVLVLFIGILIIYTLNKAPHVIIKYPRFNKLKNLPNAVFIEDIEDLDIVEQDCS
jgi:hypothetical protein